MMQMRVQNLAVMQGSTFYAIPHWLLIAIGVGFLLFMAALCVILLWKIAKNEINLSGLLEEENGGASTARFQLVLFSMVVAVGLFLYLLSEQKLPDVPSGLLTLLGVSASTYGAGKAIQFSRVEGVTSSPEEGAETTTPTSTTSGTTTPGDSTTTGK